MYNAAARGMLPRAKRRNQAEKIPHKTKRSMPRLQARRCSVLNLNENIANNKLKWFRKNPFRRSTVQKKGIRIEYKTRRRAACCRAQKQNAATKPNKFLTRPSDAPPSGAAL